MGIKDTLIANYFHSMHIISIISFSRYNEAIHGLFEKEGTKSKLKKREDKNR